MSAPLEVVTLNTWKGEGEYAERMRITSDELQRIQPDIVLLQECFAAPALGLDTAATLTEATSLHVATWLGRRKVRACEGRQAESTSGLAILSRHPIVSTRVVHLPSDPRDGDRAALFAEIDHPVGRIVAVSLHLTHLADGDALRMQQFDTVVASLVEIDPKTVVIVGGDFNASPHERFEADLPHGRLVDCRKLSAEAPTSTMVGGDVCVDHILFMDPTGRLTSAETSNALVSPDPETGVTASDHYGFRASIS